MAKIKELSITFERKISDGNFGSLGYSVTETVSLDRDDDPKEEYAKLKSRVGKKASILDKEVSENIRSMNNKGKEK